MGSRITLSRTSEYRLNRCASCVTTTTTHCWSRSSTKTLCTIRRSRSWMQKKMNEKFKDARKMVTQEKSEYPAMQGRRCGTSLCGAKCCQNRRWSGKWWWMCSRMSFVFTRNSQDEVQWYSIGCSSAAWHRTTQGLYLFPFERNAAKKIKAIDNLPTIQHHLWTPDGGNWKETGCSDAANQRSSRLSGRKPHGLSLGNRARCSEPRFSGITTISWCAWLETRCRNTPSLTCSFTLPTHRRLLPRWASRTSTNSMKAWPLPRSLYHTMDRFERHRTDRPSTTPMSEKSNCRGDILRANPRRQSLRPLDYENTRRHLGEVRLLLFEPLDREVQVAWQCLHRFCFKAGNAQKDVDFEDWEPRTRQSMFLHSIS